MYLGNVCFCQVSEDPPKICRGAVLRAKMDLATRRWSVVVRCYVPRWTSLHAYGLSWSDVTCQDGPHYTPVVCRGPVLRAQMDFNPDRHTPAVAVASAIETPLCAADTLSLFKRPVSSLHTPLSVLSRTF